MERGLPGTNVVAALDLASAISAKDLTPYGSRVDRRR